MIDVTYKRYGILKSRLLYFPEQLPRTEGYHFIICRNCFSELPCQPGFRMETQPTTIIDLTQDLEQIFSKVHKTRRNEIRQGQKMNYQITPLAPSIDILKDFRHIYNRTIVRKGAKPIICLNAFKRLLPHMTIFKALYNDKTLDMLTFIHDKYNVRAHYLAHNENAVVDKKVRNLVGISLYWEAIQYFKGLGYNIFDFGGLIPAHMSEPQGYTKFKLYFGGDIVPTFVYKATITPAARVLRRIISYNDRLWTKLFRLI